MQLYQALITLDGWTFVAQICNLMIQLVIFKKLLLNPVKKVIAERKAKADSQIADAQKLRTEAEAMKAEYEQNQMCIRDRQNYVKTLNKFYKNTPAFWQIDYSWEGFQWIVPDLSLIHILPAAPAVRTRWAARNGRYSSAAGWSGPAPARRCGPW